MGGAPVERCFVLLWLVVGYGGVGWENMGKTVKQGEVGHISLLKSWGRICCAVFGECLLWFGQLLVSGGWMQKSGQTRRSGPSLKKILGWRNLFLLCCVFLGGGFP